MPEADKRRESRGPEGAEPGGGRETSAIREILFRVFRVSAVPFSPCLPYPAPMKTNLLFEQESYQIIGACFEVYRKKGCGFVEPVYQECMEIELRLRGVHFVAQQALALEYKGCPLRAKYEPEFVCYEKIILELKAVSELAEEHRAQVQNYLKATRLKLGLLVNLGHYEMDNEIAVPALHIARGPGSSVLGHHPIPWLRGSRRRCNGAGGSDRLVADGGKRQRPHEPPQRNPPWRSHLSAGQRQSSPQFRPSQQDHVRP